MIDNRRLSTDRPRLSAFDSQKSCRARDFLRLDLHEQRLEQLLGTSLGKGAIDECRGRDTVEDAMVLGDEVLIGQTVLEKLDLWADCAGRRLVPNPANPDQSVTKVK